MWSSLKRTMTAMLGTHLVKTTSDCCSMLLLNSDIDRSRHRWTIGDARAIRELHSQLVIASRQLDLDLSLRLAKVQVRVVDWGALANRIWVNPTESIPALRRKVGVHGLLFAWLGATPRPGGAAGPDNGPV